MQIQTTTHPPGTTAPDQNHTPRVPDHELLRRIGRGSYGDVWLARNIVGTYRAVKVLYRDRFEDTKPFEREYTGIQRFEPVSRSHAGLMDILQIGRNDDQGYFYYVMELADDSAVPRTGSPSGAFIVDPATYSPSTLARLKQTGGRLPAMDCVRLGATLAGALAALHAHGLIHRDIKPSNIICAGGVPKLADIGLVTALSESFSYVGTEGFIPPEGPNSPQADLYSLGKVLYEIAMGKDRLEFPEPSTLLEDSPDRPVLLELNEVLMRACEADPRRRYQRADDMQRDLLLIQAGQSVRKKRNAEQRLRWTARLALVLAGLTVAGFSIEQVLAWRLRALQEYNRAIHPALHGKVPPRHRSTPSQLLDLSPFYNASLVEPWYPGPPENTLNALPRGVREIDGVRFDIRGIVQLHGREFQRLNASAYPARMNDLIVGRWVNRIHLFGGALFEMVDEREFARVRVRYVTGERRDIPWIYGRNVRALWQPAAATPLPGEAAPAWTGQNPATRERDLELRLYKISWDNPYPEKEILAIEFVSAQANSAPFLIAVTIDEHQPDLPFQPNTPDLRAALQTRARASFQPFPVGTPSEPGVFHKLALNRDPMPIGDHSYDGFRFTVPRGEAVDLVWAFKSAPGMHFLGWYILPMEGSLKTGFEDWHHGCLPHPPTDGPDAELCLQFLNGKKLRPGAEYFIWFQFPNAEPLEIEALLAFPKAGTVNPNQPETMADVLRLTPLLRETPLAFHRHYCLAGW
jgi:serine/threonine protein kinase